jgi:error-prone DNA polymerase
MSRKRSDSAIEAYHKRFVVGAQQKHDVDEATAERVFSMVQGFSGFGFPKAHGAAFGLLAYQSTWLRVHYSPEFLCSLLNEQPMGFYPPDALIHEAQRRGIDVLAPDVNESGAECEMQFGPDGEVGEAVDGPGGVRSGGVEEGGGLRTPGRVRIGLGYVRGVREQEIRDLVDARNAVGRYRSLSDLASRAGAGASALELLAWSGACDSLVQGAAHEVQTTIDRDGVQTTIDRDGIQAGSASSSGTFLGQELLASRRRGSARRIALWQLGVATPGRNVPGGTQLALPLDLPAPPKMRELSEWESMLADYATTGLTVYSHPMALLRDRLPPDSVTSQDLETLEHGTRVRAAGLVVARQRPGTANGIVFILLEDEYGTINLIVPAQVYERNRLLVRTEPLMLVEGKLERFAAAGGAINVLVDRITSVAAPDRLLAEVKDFSLLDEQVRIGRAEQQAQEMESEAEDFRAVAPPVMSFASGRRR